MSASAFSRSTLVLHKVVGLQRREKGERPRAAPFPEAGLRLAPSWGCHTPGVEGSHERGRRAQNQAGCSGPRFPQEAPSSDPCTHLRHRWLAGSHGWAR